MLKFVSDTVTNLRNLTFLRLRLGRGMQGGSHSSLLPLLSLIAAAATMKTII